jgi:hypothetical protein
MTQLLTLLRDGATNDDALMSTYEFDVEGLDDAWRESIQAPPPAIPGPRPVACGDKMVGNARIGIVDMGSNAIRFLVAEVTGSTAATIENHRLPVRLGRDVFETGQIPEATMADTVDAFRRFRATCDRLGVAHVRAIATSAMRAARNRDLLIDRVRVASDIDIEVISGTQACTIASTSRILLKALLRSPVSPRTMGGITPTEARKRSVSPLSSQRYRAPARAPVVRTA